MNVLASADFHLCLMPLRVTAHSGYINIVYYLCQAANVLRCFLPFRLDVQQVSVSQVFGASREWTLMCCSEARWFCHCGASGSEGHRGSRTDANKANQDGMTPLRTVVLQRLEDMMATCNNLDIAGGVAGKSSYTQRAFRRLRKKYGVELHQDNVSVVFMTVLYADTLWHPQFFGAITFVSKRLTEEERSWCIWQHAHPFAGTARKV